MPAKIEGSEEIRRALARLTGRLPDYVLDKTAQSAYDEAFKGADKHTKTGAMIRSLRLKRAPMRREIMHDGQIAPHAVFVHQGTKPHNIFPSKKKALRWPSGTGSTTGFVFAKSVRHPGTKADPWLQRAREKALRDFDKIAAEATRKWL